jgi:ATP-dependent helicase HrpB
VASETTPDRVSQKMLPPLHTPGTDLPVRSVLADVLRALADTGTAVLIAPPGTGKTTLLPLALADAVSGRVIVAEPRRIATRAAARRMAVLLGESVGQRIGYAIRGERRVSALTRVEVVTTGLLVQRLQLDPELAGVEAVIIDECHERHLDTDLALAFCADVRATLRPDLMLVATSATVEADRVAGVVGPPGQPAPVVIARAQRHRVETIWAAPAKPIPLLADARVDPRLLDHVARVVDRALVESSASVLVFLPGEAEIRGVARRISTGVEALELFGRQPGAEQDRALRPGSERRVVLATDVAESSLTVPGVDVVVDAGLSREPRTDHARGLSTLVTTKVSRSSAEQRAGRAGRTGPGRVYRCWSEVDHSHLAEHAAPEIAVADLAGFALAVSRWGHPRGAGLALMDAPPSTALEVAEQTLRALGAIDQAGRITERGRTMALVGTHPRLARALVDGSSIVGPDKARQIVALLSDDALVAHGDDDLAAAWRRLRVGSDPAATSRWRQEMKRLGRRAAHETSGGEPVSDDVAAGVMVGLAFPERLARRRSANTPNYLMAGGTGAQLDPESALRASEWIAIATADRPAGRADARIRLAAVIDETTARQVGSALLRKADLIGWVDGALRLSQVERLGAIVLSERPVIRPDPSEVAAALRDGLRAEGLGVLRWSRDSNQLRQRMWFCHGHLGAPWPAVNDDALLAQLDSWLGPDLFSVRRRGDLERIDTGRALRRLLPWPEAARLDELAPGRIEVPSGSQVRLTYAQDDPPVLAVKLQEVFGWTATPTVADGRVAVVLHLLSPAGRPVAITTDLASFWQQGYRQVRAELRGRYPRHPWPEDPTTAQPTRRLARGAHDS